MDKFVPFPKIPRLFRKIVVTEKIDGTNASVHVAEDGTVRAASRNRWITPEDDNHGFAAWVRDHEDELRLLGTGAHFGEWWGRGIQRGYGLSERRFSLFNVSRWNDDAVRPPCCEVVPVLYEGPLRHASIEGVLVDLGVSGSVAAPGFDRPEGLIVWHEAARQLFKVTLDGDQAKGR